MAAYSVENGKTQKIDDKGERLQLANFTATITREIRYVDGKTVDSYLTIEGIQGTNGEETKLPPITIPAASFPGMTWVLPNWGVGAVIHPGQGVKDDLRTAIQLTSKPDVETVYRHTGWQSINGRPYYLHAAGGIHEKGADTTLRVDLPPELARYRIRPEGKPSQGIKATLSLLRIAEPKVIWPLIAAAFAPITGPIDFGIHITGKTGTYKSELTSLIQSHYGKEMDARHLPGSWSSTANALEAQSYYAKNALFTIDDFVPIGTSWQQRNYQANADKIVRAQGNQAGRARLTDTSRLQETMYPRGLILSTGEDTPEGQSVRARMLIMELSPGDVKTDELTKAQQQRHLLTSSTYAYIQDVAARTPQKVHAAIKEHANIWRDKHLTIGHSRTPGMIGTLLAVAGDWLDHAARLKAITHAQRAKLFNDAEAAITEAAKNQQHYLEAANPCEVFTAAIRNVLGAGLGHLRTTKGGIPSKPQLLGWTTEKGDSDMPLYKSHGPCIGWISWADDEIYIEINTGYNLIKKIAGSELGLTKQTMLKRLKDDGLLTRCDEARQRNTIRITAENHPRQVIALPIAETLDTQETPE